jgi:histone-lysine N-methyltransferase SETMAR
MEHCKHLVIYWYRKGYTADKMHQKLMARAQGIVPGYSTVTNWVRALGRGEDILVRASGSGRLADGELQIRIALALDEEPFHSVRSLAAALKSSPATVWRHLHMAGYVLRHLRLVPHTLSVSQKATRVEMAIRLKNVIASAKHRGWRYFLTGDESWFYFSIDQENIWLPEGIPIPTRPKKTIASPKRMLTVFWSPLGFPVIQCLPKGFRFTGEYFCSNILREIQEKRPNDRAEDGRRKLVLHFDNAAVHTARDTIDLMQRIRMKRAPHPPFSPDLAPCDFYLFGKVKMALRGAIFQDENELLAGVTAVLTGIAREELESVFDEWLRRLDICIQREGDYVE